MTTEYETICVLEPNVASDTLKKIEDKIQKIFTSHKIKEVAKNDWGNRKLAYPINNHRTGMYVQYIYQGPGELISELEKNLGYEESVLRFLTVKFTKHNLKGVQVEPDGYNVREF